LSKHSEFYGRFFFDVFIVLLCIAKTENSAEVVESKTAVASRPSLGALPKRHSYDPVYSQDTPQRSNPFKVTKEKPTTHSNGGFFENVEKEKQILAKKAAEKSRKCRFCFRGIVPLNTEFIIQTD
jgi:hypothetical protein